MTKVFSNVINIDTRVGSHIESLRKPLRAVILTAGPTAVFVAPFWTLPDYGSATSSAPGSSLQPSNPRPTRRIPSPP